MIRPKQGQRKEGMKEFSHFSAPAAAAAATTADAAAAAVAATTCLQYAAANYEW